MLAAKGVSAADGVSAAMGVPRRTGVPRRMRPLVAVLLAAGTILAVAPAVASGAASAGGSAGGSVAVFGPSDSRWTAFYAHPSAQATWAGFCAGGGGTLVVNVLGLTPACGPVGHTQIYLPATHPPVGAPQGAAGPVGFQSVELVERYLYAKLGWVAIAGSGQRAATTVDTYARAHQLVPHRNGTHGVLPSVGDVISMWSTANAADPGETAVVTNVTMTNATRGEGTLTWVAEDDNQLTAKVRQVPITAWSIQTGRSGNGADWLDLRHSPVTVTNFTAPTIKGPYGIIAGPNRSLWFTNYSGNSIGRIAVDGTISDYTSPTVSFPGDLVVGPDGAVWFSNSSNGSIGRITANGVIGHYPSAAISGPWGVAVGPDHALWFTDNWSNAIGRLTTGGSVTRYTAPSISEPWEIVRGPDGALWFTDYKSNAIGRITTAGHITSYTAPSVSGPNDIVVGPDGALWFTNLRNNSIGRITTAGVISHFTAPTIAGPVSICRGPDGALWFTNSGNNSIGRITTAGAVSNFTAPTIAGPYDIADGPDGALWFTNSNNSIGRITTPG
jgi:virginiamycin B lyase